MLCLQGKNLIHWIIILFKPDDFLLNGITRGIKPSREPGGTIVSPVTKNLSQDKLILISNFDTNNFIDIFLKKYYNERHKSFNKDLLGCASQ